MIRLRYILKENRNTDFYDIGMAWSTNITKQITHIIVWNKWFFNRRFVIFNLKCNKIKL